MNAYNSIIAWLAGNAVSFELLEVAAFLEIAASLLAHFVRLFFFPESLRFFLMYSLGMNLVLYVLNVVNYMHYVTNM